MKQYIDLIKIILNKGIVKNNRTKIKTISIFGHQMRFNLKKGFPLLTTKKLHLPSIIHELIWFLKGETNIKYLKKNNISIWNKWANEKGDLGPIYGAQWRSWPDYNGKNIDQIKKIINEIKKNPNSRRLIVSSWNVAMIKNMAIPPCHTLFQFYVSNNKELSLQLYQRSADVFIGLPFNIASYSLLLIMISQTLKLIPYEFIHTIGDAHIYKTHIKQIKNQLKRNPKKLPKMKINPKITDIFDFKFEDFIINDYISHPNIKATVVV